MSYAVVERTNPSKIHAIMSQKKYAELWIQGFNGKYFIDESLNQNSFKILEVGEVSGIRKELEIQKAKNDQLLNEIRNQVSMLDSISSKILKEQVE